MTTKRKKAPKAPRPKLDIAKRARERFAQLRIRHVAADSTLEQFLHVDIEKQIAAELDVSPYVVRRALARKSIADASGRLANPRCPTCGQRVPGSVEADAKVRVEKAMREALESPQNQRVLAELAKR